MSNMHQVQEPSLHDTLRAATVAADQWDWEVAAGHFARAIPLDPSAGLIIQYGHMLKEAGHLEAAVSAYRAALVWDATASDGYLHLGHLLKRLGRTSEAVETFKAAERIPYGPHVRPEINGLTVAQLNAARFIRNEEGGGLKPMPDSLRQQDDVLHGWLADQNDARGSGVTVDGMSKRAVPIWGRKRIPCSLEPASNLVIDQGAYRATSGNPRMRLQLITRAGLEALCGQWIEIRLKVSGTECVVDPILFIEEAPGWKRFKTVRLERQSNNLYAVTTRLPQSVISLRLDPVHTPGKFILSELEVSSLPWSAPILRMLAKREGPGLSDVLQAALKGALPDMMEMHFSTDAADEYARWIAFNERSSSQALLPLSTEGTVGFVSMVTGGSVSDYAATLDSLRAQTSRRWELAFVLDERTPSTIRAAIEQDVARDERLSISMIAASSSVAERIAAGTALLEADLIGLLPAGDVFAKAAVASFLECAKANPSAVAIYCDHDEIDAKGRRHSPRFKPDWNRDYILGHDYVGPTVLFSRAAIDVAGGWRDKFTGTEVLDLLLRASKHAGPDGVAHLAKPVWHLRRTEATGDFIATINDFLVQEGSGKLAEPGCVPGTAKLRWPMPANSPHVTIIIPTRDRIELLKTAIDSILLRTDYQSFDIVVVDNGSIEPESFDYFTELGRDERVSVLRDDGPFNFSRLNNRAAAEAKGTVLALVNNDVEIMDGGWLREMVSMAIDPKVGAVGAKLLYGSGHVQHAGIVGGVGTVTGHGHKYEPADSAGYMNRLVVQQAVIAVTAACLVVEAEKYRAVGGLDEENLTVAFNDVDLCMKLGERGWRSVFTPWATLYHHESLSRGLDLSGERAARFQREADFMVNKWGSKILKDQFYSQNLTLDHEDFSLRYPTS